MNSYKKRRRILELFDDTDSDSDGDRGFGQFNENSRESTPNLFLSNNMGLSTSSSSDSENTDNVNISNEVHETDTLWNEDITDIQDFHFDWSSVGVANDVINCKTPKEIFDKIWNQEIMDLIVSCTNKYGDKLLSLSRPHTRNCRIQSFKETNLDEMEIFFGLCLLQSQIKTPKVRSNWSSNPLYYHPIFGASMTGRRFEQLLRCLNCESVAINDRLSKIFDLLKLVNGSFQTVYKPGKNLSLDESMMLHRGRLSFRQFIKSKKNKYGIKFYELCTHDGYALNVDIYKGKVSHETHSLSVVDSVVMSLMKPYLSKGFSLFMDNYYNSIGLSNRLFSFKTHTTGTLRTNRKGNPKIITQTKLKRGEHIWRRQGNVYVSKWKDKRDVLCITTENHPKIINVQNKHGVWTKKPIEVANYNANMSGIDRCDQMISYYSSPKKSIRWYKKVIFRLLDISVWNSYYIYKKINDSNIGFLDFRDQLINTLLKIPQNSSGRNFVLENANPQTHVRYNPTTDFRDAHYQEKIPAPPNYKRKTYFLKCKYCYRQKIIKFTSHRCQDCTNKPPLRPGQCFRQWHLPPADQNNSSSSDMEF
ncbi:PiggyBac transposable element-derived protein 4 [Anthophora retusa]